MISLTIDDKRIEVEEGSTILQAAEKLGIRIPTLCHHKSLAPYGACRLCLVEIEGSGNSTIRASCIYVAKDGLVVRTDTERVLKARRVMLELMLAHAPESPKLREIAEEMGVGESRFPRKDDNCILCGLCVRVCHERIGAGAVNYLNRGTGRKIAPPYEKRSATCMSCGACSVVCPTDVIDLSKIAMHEPRPIMSDYDMGLSRRSSIYIPFPQAIPKTAVIDRTTCMHFLNDTCGSCENFCEAGAIDYDQEDQLEEVDVGAVVLAPGFEQFDPDLKKELGYSRYPNVLSSMQFERLLSASGPFLGQVLRLSDEEHPKRIAWIQCVGSRDTERNYCSSVCCMYATKEAIIAKEHQPDLDCTIFYIDMRAYGKGFDQYYERAKELGVKYVRCRPSSVKEVPGTKNLRITYLSDDRDIVTEEFDMVVLSTGLRPPKEVRELAEKFGIDLDQHGFAATGPLTSVATSREGVYVCGPFEIGRAHV